MEKNIGPMVTNVKNVALLQHWTGGGKVVNKEDEYGDEPEE